jgi:hypothetical protein
MSASESNPSANEKPAGRNPAESERLATQYVEEQLVLTRAACRRTQIISILLMLVVLAYFTFLTTYVRKNYLEPKAAAEMANAYALSFVQDNGPELTGKLKREIPALIRQLPDYLIGKLPHWREELENAIEDQCSEYCRSTSEELGAHLDSFLDENKEDINALLEAGQSPEGAKQLAADLETELRLYLDEPGEDGESIMSKLAKSLELLRHIESRMERLAANKDLTEHESQLRHAIAVIMHTAERDVPKLVE